MKSSRHAKILEVISKQEIETQEELVQSLVAEGFNVTQATVSRDIKDLHLTKISDQRGGYKYTAIDKIESGITQRMRQLFSTAVLTINPSNNIIVIKTVEGSAGTVAVAVDAMHEPNILGCVAGDDTIIVVVASNDAVSIVMNEFNSMLM